MENNILLSNKEKIIILIKSNLIREKFKSQTEISSFLEKHGYYVSQSNISNYLKQSNIRKNRDGYYEDRGLKARKYILRDLLHKSEATILKPRIYGNILSEYICSNNEDLFVTFICLKHSFENYVCELLLECFDSYSIFCQSGYGCIQVLSSSKRDIQLIYSFISKLCKVQD